MVEPTKQKARPKGHGASTKASLLHEFDLTSIQKTNSSRKIFDQASIKTHGLKAQEDTNQNDSFLEEPDDVTDMTNSLVFFCLIWIALPIWIIDQLFWLFSH